MKYNASNIPLKVGDVILTVGTTRKIKSLDTSIRFECGGSISFNTIATHDNYIAYRPSVGTWFIPCVEAGVSVSKEQSLKLIALIDKYTATTIKPDSDHLSDAISYAAISSSRDSTFKKLFLEATTEFTVDKYIDEYMWQFEPTTQSPKGKIEMNENNTARKMVMVRNIDILTATPDTLISVITAIHRDIEKLEDVPVASKYVESEIAKLQKVMKKVVKQLDSRAS